MRTQWIDLATRKQEFREVDPGRYSLALHIPIYAIPMTLNDCSVHKGSKSSTTYAAGIAKRRTYAKTHIGRTGLASMGGFATASRNRTLRRSDLCDYRRLRIPVATSGITEKN